LHASSLLLTWVGLQPGLETDVHLREEPINRLRLLVVGGDIFSLTENMCPAPLESVAESWIRCPSIADDGPREVLAEDFCGDRDHDSL